MTKFFAGVIVGGLFSGSGLAPAVFAEAGMNGTMKGYIVQDKRGREVCRDPFVQICFRGPKSYINC